MGLGVHLDKIRHFGVVHRISDNESQLCCKNTDVCFGCNAEEMFRIGIVYWDPCTIEIIIQMFYLLVAGKKHQAA